MHLEKWFPIDIVVNKNSLYNIYGSAVVIYLSTWNADLNKSLRTFADSYDRPVLMKIHRYSFITACWLHFPHAPSVWIPHANPQNLHIRSNSFLSVCSCSCARFSTQYGVQKHFSFRHNCYIHVLFVIFLVQFVHLRGLYHVNCLLEVTVSSTGYNDH